MSNSIKDSAQAFAVNQVLKYVDSNPQEAFPKLLDWADKFDKDNLYLTQRQQIRKVMEQPDSNWMRLINSLWTDMWFTRNSAIFTDESKDIRSSDRTFGKTRTTRNSKHLHNT